MSRRTKRRAFAFTLITGGNSGIGLELARQAAADGRDLILVAQNAAALETSAAELNRKVAVHTIVQDLSQPGAAELVYDHVRMLGVEVDCLINNAGFGDHGPFATSDPVRPASDRRGGWPGWVGSLRLAAGQEAVRACPPTIRGAAVRLGAGQDRVGRAGWRSWLRW